MGVLIFAAGSMSWPPLISRLRFPGVSWACPLGIPLAIASVPLARRLYGVGLASRKCIVLRLLRMKHLRCEKRGSFGFSQRPRQDCHARRDSVVYLVDNDRLWAIGDFRRQFKPADDRPGMHHDSIAFG